jgi:hypothetical protein
VPEAVVALADCYLNGAGELRSPAKVVSLLRAAFAAGNVQVRRKLLAISHDGRKPPIKRNLAVAQEYFARIEDQLDPGTLKVETLLLLAASQTNRSGYRAVQRQLLGLRPQDRPSAVRKLRSVNPNAYIYAVQFRLGGLGFYAGDTTGRLSRNTVRAKLIYCGGRDTRAACGESPMTTRVTKLLSSAF